MFNHPNHSVIFIGDIDGSVEEVLDRQILRLAGDLKLMFIPDDLAVSVPTVAQIRYHRPFSFVDHADKWLPLRNNSFARVVVIGNGTLKDDVEILAALAHLDFACVQYAECRGARDITGLVRNLRMDFFKTHPTATKLTPADQEKLLAEINLHYLSLVAENHGIVPVTEESQASRVRHFQTNVGLPQDLMMRCPDISGNAWWVYALDQADNVVHSLDVRLAYARVLEQLPNVESALEVGCGSGFVSLYMAAAGRVKRVSGCDVAGNRVRGARLLADFDNLAAEFDTASAERLPYGDQEFDLVFTCFVLEQCKDILDAALDELLRVSRRWVILFEPSIEAFPTFPGLVHIPGNGFPTRYTDLLIDRRVRFSMLRPVLRHYYNPGALYLIAAKENMDTQALSWDLASTSKQLVRYE